MNVLMLIQTMLAAEAPAGGGTAPSAAPGGAESLISMLTLLGPMLIIMYLFIIRPQSKERKKKEEMIGALKVKDKVVTIGGLHGTVSDIDGDDVVLLVDNKKDVKLKFRRSAIGDIVRGSDEKDKDKK
jgi:preprotein translocase subunit YajC